ncbi:VOC family protein [Pseudonocardia spinosispora]|uniref:VOC family protein n=1 Tax=Pseudonocardia spinosispora TaxID=103441 RepID=UPI0004902D2B|nr:VOC family protein [Pseudonocardia spinosispora]
MITAMSHGCIYVLDQDSAKAFYTEKLGFTLTGDFDMGEGIRWLTVSPPEQPGLELVLADCRMGHDAETAEQLRALVAKGAIGPGVLATEDCHKTYRELVDRGVEFMQEPAERFYGIEALFRDDSGNWFSLSQRQS